MEASAFGETAALPWQLQAAEGDPRGGEALAPDSLREWGGVGRPPRQPREWGGTKGQAGQAALAR